MPDHHLTETDYWRDAVAQIWADRLDISVMYEAVTLAETGAQFHAMIDAAVDANDLVTGIAAQKGKTRDSRTA